MSASNAVAATLTDCPMGGISAPNAAIRFRVTAGTVLHKTPMPLTQWFLAFYLVCQDKRGISAVQLSSQLGTTYKTAWYMLKRIRSAMEHQFSGVIEFDNSYFGGPTVGQKRGHGTERAKVWKSFTLCQQISSFIWNAFRCMGLRCFKKNA